ncbi:extracellular solute-binding protein [Paenibacillus aurantius]|uniref:Extracellular solute-binding protein n=1 Tax=Paenibacillus aurantius TaxID=2918900 RepID=A0AA96LKS9_9BACL|nr:extracellular solute-binding protein [Paenibacillus aurantius]WNQ13906.1 extracellular solute-binding protein [Paenibacillus aurantius]
MKKGLLLGLTLTLVTTVFAGCSKNGDAGSASTPAPGSSASATKTPGKPQKVRVSVWDRSNSPDGTKITDSVIVKWIQENALKEDNLEVEYVPLPRSQETEKLNVWMASGEAPDIIITYNADLVFQYAEQGGVWQLDELLDKYGADINKLIKPALDTAGTYKGKRYAIPAFRMSQAAGPSMKIRQDWLDKLGLKAPTTLDELYTVLKAFKEKDPGGVGKENVVPWAIPAINQSAKGFFFGPMWGAGVNSEGPGIDLYMPTGNLVSGQFHSSIDTQQGKEFFAFMNKLYKEGLISKEFVTDVNSQKYTQQYTSGQAGFVDSNDDPWSLTVNTRKTVPTAKWVTVMPFKRSDGSQYMQKASSYGLFNMVPKTTKNPEAAVKFLNFLAKHINVVQSGIEGTHYKVENGLRLPIDPDKNAKEIGWYLGDLNLLTQGYMGPPTKEQLLKMNTNPEYAELLTPFYEQFEKYGKEAPFIDSPRPVAQKNIVNLTKYGYEALSKAIIASDFEKEWTNTLDGWVKLGGRDYDKEISEKLAEMKKK